MTEPYDAVVIGAGHNGLITAALLSRAGMRVAVLERSDHIGGATSTVEFAPGFKVNPGAHWAGSLDASVIHELGLDGQVSILPAEPMVFAPTPDGRALVFWQDLDPTLESIRAFSPRDADQWMPFNELLGHAAGLLNVLYDDPPPSLPSVALRDLPGLARTGRYLKKLGKRQMMEVLRVLPMSIADLLDEWFESDIIKGTIGTSGIVGIMQGPMAGGTAAVMLHHELGGAMGSPKGGLGELAWALANILREQGGDVRTEAPVQEILVRDGAVRGVVLEDGEEIIAGRVISSADPKHTFLQLLDPTTLPVEFVRSIENIRFRGACAKVHLALDGLPTFTAADDPAMLHGAISISPSIEYLERAYDDAKYGAVSAEPYLEAVIPSLSDDSFAPAGKHVMSVFVQYAPYHLASGEWRSEQRAALGDAVVRTLSKYAPGLESKILHRDILTPLDIEERFGMTEGSINHGELALDQFYFARPVAGCADYRGPVSGLYLCGAGMHGGGGVNGVPGRNAARAVLSDAKQARGMRAKIGALVSRS